MLRDLFATVIVPPAMTGETPRIERPAWLVERSLQGSVSVPSAGAGLGEGETAAIALAIELNAARILLDDRPARRLARSLGVRVVRTLGSLLLNTDGGLLPAVRPAIDALLETGFYLGPWVIDDALATAGEGT